jgi:hypothetical protein
LGEFENWVSRFRAALLSQARNDSVSSQGSDDFVILERKSTLTGGVGGGTDRQSFTFTGSYV